ncbi:MAG: 2,3-bisphosphoglycerate-independent phosphoglycerate mutase [Patescibacteria group bacterium]|nr:2,3-bisphosphoglycerate-independent phosphoglycerate mutase [Patescibacteria group bacterium]MDD5715837.1 2,3-bisphosphoglycerate-independent phosphoglycerate mutase [Patescibacteria group bacterium]
MKLKRPLALIIMDGWGIGENDEHNPIFLADTPNIDFLMKTYPHTIIGAAGEFIGLTPGHQGSSEIGHLIIGAGRNVLLPQTQIKHAMDTGEIMNNPAYLHSLEVLKKTNGRLHLMGLLSDQGVHSYDRACHLLLKLAKDAGVPNERIFIHVFSDGRDVGPQTSKLYTGRLAAIGIGRVASIMGRYWAMDRDHRWERVEKAYTMLTEGKADYEASSVEAAIDMAYKRDETDEFIKPTVILRDGCFNDGDVVWNFCYRVDREIEITQALIETSFTEFKRAKRPAIHYVAMTDYYEGIPCPVAFVRQFPKNTLGEILSKNGLAQFRCTETEKWVYVTKIFNGLQEDPFPGEVRKLIPSDKIATYDLKPEMKAMEIAKELVQYLHQRAFDVYIVNFANPDMLGHTGNKKAIMKGIHVVDTAIGLVYEELMNVGGTALITADHGDAEIIWDKKLQQPHTFHSDNHVPFIFIDDEHKTATLREMGTLRDVAPTVLNCIGIKQPPEMTGSSLIARL